MKWLITMELNLLKEIIQCLPKERTLFHYCKDRYAPMLLNHFIGDEMDIKEIKGSQMAGLLQKPVMREFLSSIGNGKLRKQDLNDFWIDDTHSFVLTLGSWGGKKPDWHQTCRKGYNLVLQLNFTSLHDGDYAKLMKPSTRQALNYHGHPVFFKEKVSYERETLAWSRIDLDFKSGEALIEEIQSDWIRRAAYTAWVAKSYHKNGYRILKRYRVNGEFGDVISYYDKTLKPYLAIWSEAMLSATIEFIRTEIGINKIYYHSYETGSVLKKIQDNKPPRSLYDKLPRQFCFKKSYYPPEFLEQDKYFSRNYRRIYCPEWFYMEL